MYYLFSIKMNAWLGKGGVYTSRTQDAQRVTFADALKLVKKHWDPAAETPVLLPVEIAVLEQANE